MNRYLAIFIILLVISAVVGGTLFFLNQNSTAPTQQGEVPAVTFPPDSNIPVSSDINSKSAVQTAFKKEIAPYDTDHTKLYETVIAGSYALQVWKGDNLGGEALLKYNDVQGRWIVITGGGGSWSIHGLVQAGVPQSAAEALIQGVPH